MKKEFLLIIALLLLGWTNVQAQSEESEDDLLELSLEDLMNLTVVTASKSAEKVSDAPGVITTITSKEIEQFGALNLTEVLDRVAGTFNMSSYLNVQGATSIRGDLAGDYENHVLILINGRPFRESLFGGTNIPLYLALPVNIVERIEVVRGPGSVLYGTNAYSGVINIITKTGDESGAEIEAIAGSFKGKGVSGHYNFNKEDLHILAGFKFFDEEGWDFTATDLLGVTNSINFGEKNLGGNLMLNYKGLSINSVFTKSDQNILGTTAPIWDQARPIQDVRLDYSRSMVDIGYEHEFSGKVSTSINATYNGFSGGEGIDVEYESKDWLLEVTNYITPSEKLDIVVGGTLYAQNGKLIQSDVVFIPDYSKSWYNGYAQISYKPIKQLKLIAGAQLNKVEGVDANFAPRLGAVYNISEKFGVKALYGEAFRAPFALETNINATGVMGNQSLTPEVLKNFDAQFFYHASKVELSATYFNSKKEDNISRTFTPLGQLTWINANEIKSSGIELEGKFIPNKNWYFTGSYAYQQNEIDFFGTVIEDFSLMPNSMLKLGVNYSHPKGISLGVFNTTVSDFIDPSTLGAQVRNGAPEGFSLVSAKLNFDITKLFDMGMKKPITLGIYGTNLLDEEIKSPDFATRLIDTTPGRSGRAIYGTLNIKL